jgi:hypothetical protein
MSKMDSPGEGEYFMGEFEEKFAENFNYERFGSDVIDTSNRERFHEDFGDDPFLDAVALKASLAFDPDAARRIAWVVGKAAEIVEASGTERRDKLSPYGSNPIRAYNVMIRQQSDLIQKAVAELGAARATPGTEMQSLHEKLSGVETKLDKLSQAGAVSPEEPHSGGTGSVEHPNADELSAPRVFLIGGIPIATIAVGGGLLIESAVDKPITPNPYMALFIFLVGLALFATAVAVLRDRRPS